MVIRIQAHGVSAGVSLVLAFALGGPACAVGPDGASMLSGADEGGLAEVGDDAASEGDEGGDTGEGDDAADDAADDAPGSTGNAVDEDGDGSDDAGSDDAGSEGDDGGATTTTTGADDVPPYASCFESGDPAQPCGASAECMVIEGLDGSFCSPSCATEACPAASSGSALASCALGDDLQMPPTNCALLCDLQGDECPTGMTCVESGQPLGVCLFVDG